MKTMKLTKVLLTSLSVVALTASSAFAQARVVEKAGVERAFETLKPEQRKIAEEFMSGKERTEAQITRAFNEAISRTTGKAPSASEVNVFLNKAGIGGHAERAGIRDTFDSSLLRATNPKANEACEIAKTKSSRAVANVSPLEAAVSVEGAALIADAQIVSANSEALVAAAGKINKVAGLYSIGVDAMILKATASGQESPVSEGELVLLGNNGEHYLAGLNRVVEKSKTDSKLAELLKNGRACGMKLTSCQADRLAALEEAVTEEAFAPEFAKRGMNFEEFKPCVTGIGASRNGAFAGAAKLAAN